MSNSRIGGSKDSPGIRQTSNRPMSSSPSRTTVESHYQHRGSNYQQQHAGNEQSHSQHPTGNLTAVGGSTVADGVYSNKRLMHACTCLIGTAVQVIFRKRFESRMS